MKKIYLTLIGFMLTGNLVFAQTTISIFSDATWKASASEDIGWNNVGFDDSFWVSAVDIGPTEPNSFYNWGSNTRVIWPIDAAGGYLRKVFNLSNIDLSGGIWWGVDDNIEMYINGHLLIVDQNCIAEYGFLDINQYFLIGDNVIAAKVIDCGGAQGFAFELNLQSSLTVEENGMDTELRVYPNPTAQSLYVSHPNVNKFTIRIVDLTGKQLYLGTINKEEPLDVSNFTKGIYMVTIENKEINKKKTYKFVKK